MTIHTISIANDELIVIARKEFEALMEKAGILPARPKPDKDGTVDARKGSRYFYCPQPDLRPHQARLDSNRTGQTFRRPPGDYRPDRGG